MKNMVRTGTFELLSKPEKHVVLPYAKYKKTFLICGSTNYSV